MKVATVLFIIAAAVVIFVTAATPPETQFGSSAPVTPAPVGGGL